MNPSFSFTKILRNPFLIFILLSIFLIPFLTTGIFESGSWAAEEFPSKEIKLVVAYPPGGGVDIVARFFADKVEKILGVPVMVVNTAAGGGTVGALSVVQAKPDGYTLLAGPTGLLITRKILTPELPYRHTDFTPVCGTIVMPMAIFVRNELPWKSLKELVDYAKKNPGKLRVSIAAPGSFLDVMANLFKSEAGIDMTVVPTIGGATVTATLLGGHVELSMETVTPGINYVKAGRLRALVSTHKLPDFPMLKTFEEEGYPGVSLKMWHGIFAPKGLPNPILTKLTKAFKKACDDPSLQEQLGKEYILPDYRDPEEASKRIENEYEITFKILKQAGIVK